ncbi:MAG: hypothetical protein K2Q10_05490 [Rhodospirillales bacterium]|nr:hypothetical protein [Rhodospirillales bacterium]
MGQRIQARESAGRLTGRIVIAGLLLAGLTACSQGGGPPVHVTTPSSEPGTTQGTPAPTRQVSLPAPGAVASDPARLHGLGSLDVKAMLGVPNFQRSEEPAEVWQYFGQGCILDLFLYDEEGMQRVAFAQVRGPLPGEKPNPTCVGGLLDGRRGQRLS